jgi:FtsP/CotA-like multicopper oxidase with cupredoxin domain
LVSQSFQSAGTDRHYGPYLIDPADGEPVNYDRDFVVVLFDWTFENPMRVLDKIVRALSWDGAGK